MTLPTDPAVLAFIFKNGITKLPPVEEGTFIRNSSEISLDYEGNRRKVLSERKFARDQAKIEKKKGVPVRVEAREYVDNDRTS